MGLFKKDGKVDWLVAGLGNPGLEYEDTRHNAGFDVVDRFADEIGASYWKSECGSLVAHKPWQGLNIALAKPQSFMNLSGAPVSQLLKKYDVDADHLIVVHDELDIAPGTIRVKFGGGHGGHNGMRSIFEKTGTRDFYRIRIGIGRPPGKMPVTDYVLQAPRKEAFDDFEEAIKKGSEAISYLIENGLIKTQDKFN